MKTDASRRDPQSGTDVAREVLAKNVAVDMAARIGYLLTRVGIPPFVLAHVGLPAYGLWATVFVLVSYLGISTLGLSNVYIKYTAQYAATGDYRRANGLLATGFAMSVPLCLLLFGLLWGGWGLVERYVEIPPALQSDAKVVVLLVAGMFLASLACSVFRDALAGVQKIAGIQLIWTMSYVVETVLIVLLVGAGRGIRGLAEAFAARIAVDLVATAVFASRTLPWLSLRPSAWSGEHLRTLLTFGGTVQTLGMLSIALNSFERLLAAPLLGLSATGLLDLGKKLPSMAASVPSAFAAALIPAASDLEARSGDGRAAMAHLYVKGARYMNLATGYLCAFLAVGAGALLSVWMGASYPDAILIMTLFSVSTQAHLMTGPGTSILRGIGRPCAEFHYALPNVVALGLTLAGSYLVAGGWTVVGLSGAVAAATVLAMLWFLIVAHRWLAVPGWLYVRRVVIAGLVPYLVALPTAAPMIWLVNPAHRWSGAAIIVVSGGLYTLALAAVTFRYVLDADEQRWVRQALNHRWRTRTRWAPAT
jgi:O-antigen/teichoic acid export membrane protein